MLKQVSVLCLSVVSLLSFEKSAFCTGSSDKSDPKAFVEAARLCRQALEAREQDGSQDLSAKQGEAPETWEGRCDLYSLMRTPELGKWVFAGYVTHAGPSIEYREDGSTELYRYEEDVDHKTWLKFRFE